MSLIHGSMGITYFVHEWYPSFSEPGIFRYPEIVAAVKEINTQITELAPVLNSPTIENGAQVSSSVEVKTMVKNHEGNVYLFSVAMRDTATVATFTIPGLPTTTTAEVLGEDRQITVNNGQFQDSFDGYGVHLYKIRLLPPANTYYVAIEAMNCSDLGPGTDSQPWCTLAKAAATAKAGETVLIKAGEYNEILKPANSGVAGNPITFKSYGNGETAIKDISSYDERVLSHPSDPNPYYGPIWLEDKEYIVIDGINITGGTNGYIRSVHSNNNIIKNCHFKDSTRGFNKLGNIVTTMNKIQIIIHKTNSLFLNSFSLKLKKL